MFFIKRDYFNKTMIIKGLYTALLLSACIFLTHFHIEYKLFHTIIALLAFYQLLITPRLALFYTGFFTAIFWFYWVSFSFIYYDLIFLIPLVILAFALIYGVLFLCIGLINHLLYKTIAFIALSYIAPFGFDWFKPQIILTHTYFEPTTLCLTILLIGTWFLIHHKKLLYALTLFIAFIFSTLIHTQQGSLLPSEQHIAMPTFKLNQEEKWEKKNLSSIIQYNFQTIYQAIEDSKDIVILPETAFPILLNKEETLLQQLKTASKEIAIITGALYKDKHQYNNSTYLFQDGTMQVAHKVVLVPFGEQIPFPKFVRDFINDIFYDGAQDYESAAAPTDFIIGDEKFRNAICYEATSKTIYKNLQDVPYVIAISNNAWFTPSIEPTLQKMLMQYYAKKYGVIIYHVANGSNNAVIHP